MQKIRLEHLMKNTKNNDEAFSYNGCDNNQGCLHDCVKTIAVREGGSLSVSKFHHKNARAKTEGFSQYGNQGLRKNSYEYTMILIFMLSTMSKMAKTVFMMTSTKRAKTITTLMFCLLNSGSVYGLTCNCNSVKCPKQDIKQVS